MILFITSTFLLINTTIVIIIVMITIVEYKLDQRFVVMCLICITNLKAINIINLVHSYLVYYQKYLVSYYHYYFVTLINYLNKQCLRYLYNVLIVRVCAKYDYKIQVIIK